MVLNIRLDPKIAEDLQAFMKSSGMTQSQAGRTLLRLALVRNMGVESTFKLSAYQEGMRTGLGIVRSRMAAAFATAMQDIDGYVIGSKPIPNEREPAVPEDAEGDNDVTTVGKASD